MTRIIALLCWTAVVGLPATAQQSTPLRPGDRVWLHIEGEPTLSDTFTVGPGPSLTLPVLGAVSLTGVPRSGIEPFLTEHLERFLRAPVVRARALIRIAIAGQVQRPGFYAVPTDLVLPDAVMLAGGATSDAVLEKMRVERGEMRLLEPSQVSEAVAMGRTLDALNLEAGDRITVPRRSGGFERWVPILLGIPAAAFALSQLF